MTISISNGNGPNLLMPRQQLTNRNDESEEGQRLITITHVKYKVYAKQALSRARRVKFAFAKPYP